MEYLGLDIGTVAMLCALKVDQDLVHQDEAVVFHGLSQVGHS
jgi:hypothetical protein